MKAKYVIEKRQLPNHEELPLLQSLRSISAEHGYHGIPAMIWFYIVVMKDYLFHLLAKISPVTAMAVRLHRWRGVQIGKNVHIGPGVTIDDAYPCYVRIGNRVAISGNDYFLTHTKPMLFHKKVMGSSVAPINVEDDAWIAIGVIILPGVTIGRGSIIASGSVVTKSIPPFVMAAGMPAVVKKDLAELVRHNYSDEQFLDIMKKRKDEFGF